MKTNNLTFVFKIIIILISMIVVCIICAVVLTTANSGKALVNGSTNQLYKLTADNGNITEASYDGVSVMGSELVALISDTIESGQPLSVVVRTLQSSRTDYYYVYDETRNTIETGGTAVIQQSKAQGDYINRDSLFKCDVKKDINGAIICLWFEQQ